MENTALIAHIFNFEENEVRIIVRNGEFWFVGLDVCKALGIINHKDALSRLPPHQRDEVGISDPIGRLQGTGIISEPAVYKLAFRSNKPEAERFTDRVASEVLPAIRKTGSYSVAAPEADSLTEAAQLFEVTERVLTSMEESFERMVNLYRGVKAFNRELRHTDQKRLRLLTRTRMGIEQAGVNGMALSPTRQKMLEILDECGQAGIRYTDWQQATANRYDMPRITFNENLRLLKSYQIIENIGTESHPLYRLCQSLEPIA